MNKSIKRCLSIVLLVCIFVMHTSTVLANQAKEPQFVTIDIERFTLGQGYYIEPVKIPYEEGDTAASITMKLFQRYGIEFKNTGSVEGGDFYLAAIKDADTGSIDIPAYITDNGGPSNEDNDGNDDEYLGEFDYSSMSGWMITVNHIMIDRSAAAYEVHPDDVIRWQFTVWGYGADLGMDTGWGNPHFYEEADKSQLLLAIADVNTDYESLKTDAAYVTACQTASKNTSTQDEVNTAHEKLESTIAEYLKPKELDKASVKELSEPVNEAVKKVSDFMSATVTNPQVGSIGGEWAVLQLARSGYMSEEFKNQYITNAEAYVKSKNGILHSVKYTEYSRMIIALTAIGENPTKFAGYDLVAPLSDYAKTIKQGINGPIFALIAMDTGNYEFQEIEDSANQNSRERMVQYILEKKLSGGGWALSGTNADPDITAMAIQALAKYYSTNEEVKAAVDEALDTLSKLQNESGGYSSWGSVNSESIAQVIVALCELGIDPSKDTRFIQKDGSWLLSALMSFAVPTEQGLSFGHASLETNQMATEQAGYALVAYNRLLNHQTSLYTMTEVSKDEPKPDDNVVATGECGLVVPAVLQNAVNTTFNVSIRVGSVASHAKVIQSVLNISPYLEVTDVQVSGMLLNGNLDYNLADHKLRIVYGDFTKNSEIEFKGDLPVDLITIGFRLKEVVPEGSNLAISLEEMKQLISSDEVVVMNDVNKVIEIPLNNLAINAVILYQGDGIDLIPADKTAVKVTITGFTDLSKQVGFSCGESYATLYVSKDFTKSSGVQTYLMVVDSSVTLEQLLNAKNYQVYNDVAAEEIAFGDTNSDTYIDAQDALNVVSAWLRKGNTEVNSKVILSYNVNADHRIDTEDALGIVEYFVTTQPYKIMTK